MGIATMIDVVVRIGSFRSGLPRLNTVPRQASLRAGGHQK